MRLPPQGALILWAYVYTRDEKADAGAKQLTDQPLNDAMNVARVSPPQHWSLPITAVVSGVIVLLFLGFFSCPPWSLKSVIAQRAQCQANLKRILVTRDDLRIPVDDRHSDQIRELLMEMNLSCTEGTDVHRRPARYVLQSTDGRCIITEEHGNHPARARFMAGAVRARRHGIDGRGEMIQLR
jgi:hypothetical protein